MSSPRNADHPIRIAPEPRAVQVTFSGAMIASTEEALVLREANYPPVYYIPREAVEMGYLTESATRTTCPYKGEARYWSIAAQNEGETDAVWSYDDPKPVAQAIAGHMAFYPDKVTITVG